MLKKFKNASFKSKVIISLIVLVALTFAYYYFRGGNNTVEILTVKKDTVTQEVAVTGKTEAMSKVDLAFEKSGKVVSANVDVGDQVVAGQLLASVDYSDLQAQLLQASAGLRAAKSRLNEINIGARPEDVGITSSQLDSAKVSMVDAERDLFEAVQNAYLKSDEAIYYYTDTFYYDPRTTNAVVNFPIYDAGQKIALGLGRIKVEKILVDWKRVIEEKQTDSLGLYEISRQNLLQVKNFIDDLSVPINALTTDTALGATAGTYKSISSAARTNLNGAISSLSASYEKYNATKSSLATIQRQFDLKVAKPTDDTLIQQQAQVDQAQASYDLVAAQIAKARIVAPIDGIVTKFEVELGEIANPGVIAISIISPDNLEITANVPEVDIGKVKIDNPVRIVFDAFSDEEFFGKVFYIEPAETIIDGVVNYKIKLQIDKKDERIKSGLTASVNIQTMTKKDVLTLPNVAIIENDNGTFVEKVIDNQTTMQVPVTVGVRGQNGLVEVVKGLAEGESVLNVGIK